jgi:NAD(P)-dependent dehydrogenase (short-subunit alcohol dehydrogenase family)
MKIQSATAFVTGASRGIGRALVQALLDRQVRRVYAAARAEEALPALRALDAARVVPVRLDVRDEAQCRAAAQTAADADLLINNAGSLAALSVLTCSADALSIDLDTNLRGPLNLARAFLPALERKPAAAIVNVLTVVSLASMAGFGGYSASKAAAWSVTQSLRAELQGKGVTVHAVFPGPVDTDMLSGVEMPKTPPAEVAAAVLAGVAAGSEDIFPDPMSRDWYATYSRDPKALERAFRAM